MRMGGSWAYACSNRTPPTHPPLVGATDGPGADDPRADDQRVSRPLSSAAFTLTPTPSAAKLLAGTHGAIHATVTMTFSPTHGASVSESATGTIPAV
jgi:hypothetical protein